MLALNVLHVLCQYYIIFIYQVDIGFLCTIQMQIMHQRVC